MKYLFRLGHGIIVGYFALTGNGIYDKVLSSIIGVISYIYAFIIVGRLYNEIDSNTTMMSFVHWVIRTFVSLIMIFATRTVYQSLVKTLPIKDMIVSEIMGVAICSLFWIIIAEFLKYKTGLKKNYY